MFQDVTEESVGYAGHPYENRLSMSAFEDMVRGVAHLVELLAVTVAVIGDLVLLCALPAYRVPASIS